MSFPFDIIEHELDGQHIRHHAASTLDPDVPLKLHVKQYVPKTNRNPQPGAVTILAVHCSGFTKETYEPLFADLLARYPADSASPGLRGIWVADTTNMGYSATLNAGNLGNKNNYFDHARDLLLLTNVFRAQLPPPLVGLGHSMGTVPLAFLAVMHPSLFAGLALIDSIITDLPTPNADILRKAFVFKKDVWPTRAAAEASIRSSRFFTPWDARALDALCAHGFVPLPNATYPDKQGWTLRTSKHQEGANSYGAEGGGQPENARMFRLLPLLVPPVLLLKATRSVVASMEAHRRLLRTIGTALDEGASNDAPGTSGGGGGAASGQVTVAEVDGGHFVPFEQPGAVADALAPWLRRTQDAWCAARARWLRDWQARSADERQRMEPAFVDGIARLGQAPPPRKSKSKM